MIDQHWASNFDHAKKRRMHAPQRAKSLESPSLFDACQAKILVKLQRPFTNVNLEVSILTEPIRQVGVLKIDGAGDPGGSPGQENRMKRIMLTSVLLALAASTQQQTLAASTTQKAGDVSAAPTAAIPAGSYTLDKQHASLIFRVNHLGFSNYTARFKRFDAQLKFDPQNLAASKVVVTVDANSLETDFPNPALVDFNAKLKGDEWLDVAKFSEIVFESREIVVTGQNTMRIVGDLTLHGARHPITLETTFNGGYAGHPMDPNARIGFSAHGTLKRSEFGITYGIPAPGTTMGVSDDVNVIIEVEFTGPPLASSETTRPSTSSVADHRSGNHWHS